MYQLTEQYGTGNGIKEPFGSTRCAMNNGRRHVFFWSLKDGQLNSTAMCMYYHLTSAQCGRPGTQSSIFLYLFVSCGLHQLDMHKK